MPTVIHPRGRDALLRRTLLRATGVAGALAPLLPDLG